MEPPAAAIQNIASAANDDEIDPRRNPLEARRQLEARDGERVAHQATCASATRAQPARNGREVDILQRGLDRCEAFAGSAIADDIDERPSG